MTTALDGSVKRVLNQLLIEPDNPQLLEKLIRLQTRRNVYSPKLDRFNREIQSLKTSIVNECLEHLYFPMNLDKFNRLAEEKRFKLGDLDFYFQVSSPNIDTTSLLRWSSGDQQIYFSRFNLSYRLDHTLPDIQKASLDFMVTKELNFYKNFSYLNLVYRSITLCKYLDYFHFLPDPDYMTAFFVNNIYFQFYKFAVLHYKLSSPFPENLYPIDPA